MYSHTMAALEKFDNQHDFERMCADILNASSNNNVVLVAPQGGSDDGKDIIFTTEDGKRGLACVTLRKNIEKKFLEDFSQRKAGDFDHYMLFCTAYITSAQKSRFALYCTEKLNASFIPIDIEALRSLLDSKLVIVKEKWITESSSISGFIWYVPYQRNLFFTGRKHILENTYNQFFCTKESFNPLVQVISGLGGIGKTQMAVEYTYFYQNSYKAILWINADTNDNFINDLVNIANLLHLTEDKMQEQNFIVQAVKGWLSTHSSWLLILDNIQNVDIYSSFLSIANNGHILITTNNQTVGPATNYIHLEKMSIEEGIILLLRRSKTILTEIALDKILENDLVAAKSIVSEVDGLPLAIEQAGAYVEETACGLPHYLNLYKKFRSILLKRRGQPVLLHPASVTTTFSISFEKVQKENPVAADVLRSCAFLNSVSIPEEIFLTNTLFSESNFHSRINNDLEFDEIIGILRSFSLINRHVSSSTFSIHRLVQEVLRDLMDKEMYDNWQKSVVTSVISMFPVEDVQNWDLCQRLLPHALTCLEWIKYDALDIPWLHKSLIKVGLYLHERGQYQKAEMVFQNILDMCIKIHGRVSHETASCLNNLAVTSLALGKYKQAKSSCEDALAIFKQILGRMHQLTATATYNLAYLYDNSGKYDQAEAFYKEAQDIYEGLRGPEDLETTKCMHSLTMLYVKQRKYEQAEQILQKVLEIRSKLLGTKHPLIALSFNDIAGLYEQQGKYEQAEVYLQKALEINEFLLGEHPNVATNLLNLAGHYAKQGKYNQSKPLFQRAIQIYEQVLGVEHIDIARAFNNYAFLLSEQDEREDARLLYKKALTIYKYHFQGNHPETLSILNSLIQVCINLGRSIEAQKYIIEMQELTYGNKHPILASSLNNLALHYKQKKQYQEALVYYKQALAIDEEIYGSKHLEVAIDLNNLAGVYEDQGRYEEAEQTMLLALDMCEETNKIETSFLITLLGNLVGLYARCHNYRKAEPFMKCILGIYKKNLGEKHPLTLESRLKLAEIYIALDEKDQAKPLLQQILAAQEQVRGKDHPETIMFREAFSNILDLSN